MASKKKLSKEELRKAMLEAKKKHSVIKKIESPLARYNELDQLVCVLCKTVVRNEAVWPVHLNSKSHKDNIALAKQTKLAPPQPTPSNKRPSTFVEPQEPKKIKSILKNTGQPSTNAKTNLPPDFFENSISSNKNVVLSSKTVINDTNGNIEVLTKEEKIKEEKDPKENNQSVLPEGFFDDPIMDAKARNVEYKDPREEEWERFQKEIKEETSQSAQIIGDDQEEAANERQHEMVEEQVINWERVLVIVKQNEERKKCAKKKQDNNDESSDEEDLDDFDENDFDWRAKKAFSK